MVGMVWSVWFGMVGWFGLVGTLTDVVLLSTVQQRKNNHAKIFAIQICTGDRGGTWLKDIERPSRPGSILGRDRKIFCLVRILQ